MNYGNSEWRKDSELGFQVNLKDTEEFGTREREGDFAG